MNSKRSIRCHSESSDGKRPSRLWSGYVRVYGVSVSVCKYGLSRREQVTVGGGAGTAGSRG